MDKLKINLNFNDSPSKLGGQSDVEIFDPPMCCPTGLCGPTLDQTLLDLSEMIVDLQKEGYGVERYQMTTHPQAFLGNAEVMRLIREKQMAALPIVVVRSAVVSEGRYPTRDEILTKLNGGN
jgi:hypothetical protein